MNYNKTIGIAFLMFLLLISSVSAGTLVVVGLANITPSFTNNITGAGAAGNHSYWTNLSHLSTSPIYYSNWLIGINNTAPIAQLDVGGNVRFTGTLIGGTVPYARLSGVPNGSLTTTGIVSLVDSVTSTNVLVAATPNSVKTAYDLADSKADPGDCPSGQFVQNTTTNGVECAPVAVGGGTVTQVNTTEFLEGGPITTTGILNVNRTYLIDFLQMYNQTINITGLLQSNASLYILVDSLNNTKALAATCPPGQVLQNATATGHECVTISSSGGNSSWNESYANTLYYPLVLNPRNYLNESNLSAIYINISIINSSLNYLNQTVLALIVSNASNNATAGTAYIIADSTNKSFATSIPDLYLNKANKTETNAIMINLSSTNITAGNAWLYAYSANLTSAYLRLLFGELATNVSTLGNWSADKSSYVLGTRFDSLNTTLSNRINILNTSAQNTNTTVGQLAQNVSTLANNVSRLEGSNVTTNTTISTWMNQAVKTSSQPTFSTISAQEHRLSSYPSFGNGGSLSLVNRANLSSQAYLWFAINTANIDTILNVTNNATISGTNTGDDLSANATAGNAWTIADSTNKSFATSIPDLYLNKANKTETNAIMINVSIINQSLKNLNESVAGLNASNALKAGTGNCAAGKVVGNVTTSGVQCLTVSGTGTVTQVDTGLGMTGGPITSTGTVAMDPVSAFMLLYNSSYYSVRVNISNATLQYLRPTWNAINFSQEIFDNASMHPASGDQRIIAPRNGKLWIHCALASYNNTAMGVRIVLNNATDRKVIARQVQGNSAGVENSNAATIWDAKTNDDFICEGWASAAQGLGAFNNQTNIFEAHYLPG